MLVLKPRYESLRRNAKRLDNIYKQDYLYYGVLDFVNKVDVNLTKTLLGTDYELWKNDLINTMRKDTNIKTIYEYVKLLLRQSKNHNDIKRLIKSAKKNLDDKGSNDYLYKKAALKVMKVHLQQERNGINMLNSNLQNEYSLIIDYLNRVIRIMFDVHYSLWMYKWGETKLTASKEEANLAKNDDDKRAVGASIDGIIYSPNLDLDLLLLEVSGPMNKVDHTHFLKDRIKIAKNLKMILKSLFRKSFILSES